MGRRYTGFSLEDHRKAAKELREIEKRLRVVGQRIREAYGVSGKSGRLIDRLTLSWGVFSKLKCALDDEFYREGHDGRSPYSNSETPEEGNDLG